MFEAADVTVPSLFIIRNSKIEAEEEGEDDPDADDDAELLPSFKLTGDDNMDNNTKAIAGGVLAACPEGVAKRVKAASRFMTFMNGVGKKVSAGVKYIADKAGDVGAVVGDFLSDPAQHIGNTFHEAFTSEDKFYLYLVDERTMKPITNDPNGIFPILIEKPAEFVQKAMPLMKVGLKAMAIFNGVSGVARCLGYPTPMLSKEVRDVAKKFVGGLDQESSVAEFDCLQGTLNKVVGGENGSEEQKKSVRGSALREFGRFLEEKDPKHTFCDLRRVASPDGSCCWTTDCEVSKMREEASQKELEAAVSIIARRRSTIKNSSMAAAAATATAAYTEEAKNAVLGTTDVREGASMENFTSSDRRLMFSHGEDGDGREDIFHSSRTLNLLLKQIDNLSKQQSTSSKQIDNLTKQLSASFTRAEITREQAKLRGGENPFWSFKSSPSSSQEEGRESEAYAASFTDEGEEDIMSYRPLVSQAVLNGLSSKLGGKTPVRVYFLDNSSKMFLLQADVLVGQFIIQILQKLGVHDPFGAASCMGLFESKDGVSIHGCLSAGVNVVDSVRSFGIEAQREEDFEREEAKLVFMIRLFLPKVTGLQPRSEVASALSKESSSNPLTLDSYLQAADTNDEALLHLQFVQAVYLVITGTLLVSEEEALLLGALLFTHKIGEYKSYKYQEGFLGQRIVEFIPMRLLKKPCVKMKQQVQKAHTQQEQSQGSIDIDAAFEEWEKALFATLSEEKTVLAMTPSPSSSSPSSIPRRYMDIVFRLPDFGCTFFKVLSTTSAGVQQTAVLSVSTRLVSVLDKRKTQVLQQFRVSDLQQAVAVTASTAKAGVGDIPTLTCAFLTKNATSSPFTEISFITSEASCIADLLNELKALACSSNEFDL